MSINSLYSCLHADDVLKKIIMSGYHLGKIKEAPPCSPKFEVCAPGANLRIYGKCPIPNKSPTPIYVLR